MDIDESETTKYRKYLSEEFSLFVANKDVQNKLFKHKKNKNKYYEDLFESAHLLFHSSEELNMEELLDFHKLLSEAKSLYLNLVKDPDVQISLASDDEDQEERVTAPVKRSKPIPWTMPRQIPRSSSYVIVPIIIPYTAPQNNQAVALNSVIPVDMQNYSSGSSRQMNISNSNTPTHQNERNQATGHSHSVSQNNQVVAINSFVPPNTQNYNAGPSTQMNINNPHRPTHRNDRNQVSGHSHSESHNNQAIAMNRAASENMQNYDTSMNAYNSNRPTHQNERDQIAGPSHSNFRSSSHNHFNRHTNPPYNNQNIHDHPKYSNNNFRRFPNQPPRHSNPGTFRNNNFQNHRYQGSSNNNPNSRQNANFHQNSHYSRQNSINNRDPRQNAHCNRDPRLANYNQDPSERKDRGTDVEQNRREQFAGCNKRKSDDNNRLQILSNVQLSSPSRTNQDESAHSSKLNDEQKENNGNRTSRMNESTPSSSRQPMNSRSNEPSPTVVNQNILRHASISPKPSTSNRPNDGSSEVANHKTIRTFNKNESQREKTEKITKPCSSSIKSSKPSSNAANQKNTIQPFKNKSINENAKNETSKCVSNSPEPSTSNRPNEESLKNTNSVGNREQHRVPENSSSSQNSTNLESTKRKTVNEECDNVKNNSKRISNESTTDGNESKRPRAETSAIATIPSVTQDHAAERNILPSTSTTNFEDFFSNVKIKEEPMEDQRSENEFHGAKSEYSGSDVSKEDDTKIQIKQEPRSRRSSTATEINENVDPQDDPVVDSNVDIKQEQMSDDIDGKTDCSDIQNNDTDLVAQRFIEACEDPNLLSLLIHSEPLLHQTDSEIIDNINNNNVDMDPKDKCASWLRDVENYDCPVDSPQFEQIDSPNNPLNDDEHFEPLNDGIGEEEEDIVPYYPSRQMEVKSETLETKTIKQEKF